MSRKIVPFVGILELPARANRAGLKLELGLPATHRISGHGSVPTGVRALTVGCHPWVSVDLPDASAYPCRFAFQRGQGRLLFRRGNVLHLLFRGRDSLDKTGPLPQKLLPFSHQRPQSLKSLLRHLSTRPLDQLLGDTKAPHVARHVGRFLHAQWACIGFGSGVGERIDCFTLPHPCPRIPNRILHRLDLRRGRLLAWEDIRWKGSLPGTHLRGNRPLPWSNFGWDGLLSGQNSGRRQRLPVSLHARDVLFALGCSGGSLGSFGVGQEPLVGLPLGLRNDAAGPASRVSAREIVLLPAGEPDRRSRNGALLFVA